MTGITRGFGLLLVVFLVGCAGFQDPLTPEEHLQLGLSYEADGEYERALRHYSVAADSGEHDEAYVYMGNTHLRMDEYDRAEEHYREALDRLPDHADLHNNLAYLYLRQEIRLDEAEDLVLRAIQLNPDRSEVYEETLENIRQAK